MKFTISGMLAVVFVLTMNVHQVDGKKVVRGYTILEKNDEDHKLKGDGHGTFMEIRGDFSGSSGEPVSIRKVTGEEMNQDTRMALEEAKVSKTS